MRRILLTNDDGVEAEGLRFLAEALSCLAEVVVVAPDREQSGCGHSISLNRPLRIRELRRDWYAVDGTPTDCVNLAVLAVLKDRPADLLISGINDGLNVGDDITYSGTVNATFEGRLLGLPSVAISADVPHGADFGRVAELAADLAADLLKDGPPEDLLLNVNVPAGDWCELAVTRLGRRVYRQVLVEKTDPRGRLYYWIGGVPEWDLSPGTDHEAIAAGRVSVTPLHLDLTDYEAFGRYAPLTARLGTSPRVDRG